MKIVGVLVVGFTWGISTAVSASAAIFHILAGRDELTNEFAMGITQAAFALAHMVGFSLTAWGIRHGWFAADQPSNTDGGMS